MALSLEEKASDWPPIALRLDLSSLPARSERSANERAIAEVNAGARLSYDAVSGRATLLQIVKFEKRWHTPERVDETTAAWCDPDLARAVVDDLVKLFEAQRGPVVITRLRPRDKPYFTQERKAWFAKLFMRQGELFKATMVQGGAPADLITVKTTFETEASPVGKLFIDFDAVGTKADYQRKSDRDLKVIRGIESRGNVRWDREAGMLHVRKPFNWSQRCWREVHPDTPTAELDGAQHKDIIRDMVDVYNHFKGVRAFVRVNPLRYLTGAHADMDNWYGRLASNRAHFVKRALIEQGVPEDMLVQETTQRAARAKVECDGGMDQTERLKVRKLLVQYATSTSLDDIPKLEEVVALAQMAQMDSNKERLDHLIAQAEETLGKLQSLRRRKEAWAMHSRRDVALTYIYAPKIQRLPSYRKACHTH